MQKSFYPLFWALTAILVLGCSAYKQKQQTAALSIPELGSIVHTKGSLWYASADQIGKPEMEEALSVTVQQLPFTKVSYALYSNHMNRASKINGIAYVDSLPYKPKYLRLQLQDKIGLVQLLNGKENTNVRLYLENDDAYKIVTDWYLTLPDALLEQLKSAEKVTLVKDENGSSFLSVMQNGLQSDVSFSQVEVFDYKFSSFCWGEDRYHNKLIKAILASGENCPKGTFKKAAKVRPDKSYLKF